MTQDRSEIVQSFGAKPRGQASICKFILQCSGCEHKSDPDFQLHLLRDKNQNMTLEQVFKFVEAKEVVQHHAPTSYRRRRNAYMAKTRKRLVTKLVCVVTVGGRGTAKLLHIISGKRNVQLSDIVATTDHENHVES